MFRVLEHEDLAKQPSAVAYFAGLDLGQVQDYSAFCIIERQGCSKESYGFTCRHLQRWPLRTSFQTIVADTARMMNSRQMQQAGGKPTLAVDATGLGAPIVDLLKSERMSATLIPIQITGGFDVTSENGVTRVPKRDLVSTTQVALQNERLKIVPALPDAPTLLAELQNFQMKISENAHDIYGGREGAHDDLVLAVALALWTAKRPSPKFFSI